MEGFLDASSLHSDLLLLAADGGRFVLFLTIDCLVMGGNPTSSFETNLLALASSFLLQNIFLQRMNILFTL